MIDLPKAMSIAVFFSLLSGAVAMAYDVKEQRAAHVAKMLEMLNQEDDYAAMEFAIGLEDRRQAIYALHDLIFKVYYDRKDLPETILVGADRHCPGAGSGKEV